MALRPVEGIGTFLGNPIKSKTAKELELELARQAELERQRKIREYQELMRKIAEARKKLVQTNKKLSDAKEKLQSAYKGAKMSEFIKEIEDAQGKVREIDEKLTLINGNANKKISNLGGTPDISYDDININVKDTQSYANTGKYSCDTDVLRDIIPTLKSALIDLNDATEKTSKLPSLEGCENVASIGVKGAKEEGISGVIKKLQQEIETAERLEEENIKLLERTFGANPDIPFYQPGMEKEMPSWLASISNIGVSFTKGLGKALEYVVDAFAIFGTAAADAGRFEGGQFIPWEPGTKDVGVSEEYWKDVMGFVATEHVESAYKNLYANTKVGQWLDKNAYDPFKSTGVVSEISSGIGDVAGVAGLTILTGVPAPLVAGVSATGKYTEQYWVQAKEDMPKDWETEETRNNGIFYGAANGVWEGAQWTVGGALNNLTIKGAKPIVTSTVKVGIDTAFNALDTPFKALIDSVTSKQSLKDAWKQQGGWNSVLVDTGVGLIGSVGGEIYDNILANNALKDTKADIGNSTSILKSESEVVINEKEVLKLIKDINSGKASKEQLRQLLGGEKLEEVFQKDMIDSMLDTLIATKKVHMDVKGNGLKMLEGLINRNVTDDDLFGFFVVKPEYILQLSKEEREKLAKSFCGVNANQDMMDGLQLLWDNGIATKGCHDGSNDLDEYVLLHFGSENKEAKEFLSFISQQDGITSIDWNEYLKEESPSQYIQHQSMGNVYDNEYNIRGNDLWKYIKSSNLNEVE